MPKKIRNMGTATMRFNEGIVVSGSIDTSYASKEGVAVVCTGSLEIAANSTNNQVIRIISDNSQREMVFDSFVTSGGGSGNAAFLNGNNSGGLRILDPYTAPASGNEFRINDGTLFTYKIITNIINENPPNATLILIERSTNQTTMRNRIIGAINGTAASGDVRYHNSDSSNRASVTASENGAFNFGINLTANVAGTGGNNFTFFANTNALTVSPNSDQPFGGGSAGSSSTTQETIASIFTETDDDLIISGSKEVHIRSGEGKAVMILSGTIGGANSPNPSNFTDTNLFVSGTIGSMGTAVKGTSVFGGDLHVSGAAQINTVTVTKEGKVGIGTTTPAHKLEVGGNMSVGEKIMHRNDTDTFIQFPNAEDQINMAAGNVNFFKIIKESSTPHITVFNDDGAGIDVHFKAQGGNDLLVLDASDGRAGVGTDSPISKLDVRGQITAIETDDSADIKLYRVASNGDLANDTALGEIHIGGSESGTNFFGGAKIQAATTEAWNPGTAEGTSLSFWTTANTSNSLTKRMEITNDGAVAIGDVPANEKLTVNGVLSLGQTSAPTHTNNYGKLYVKSSDSVLYFKNNSGTEFNLLNASDLWTSDGTNVYLVDSNNKVGIGTTSPDTKVEIVYTGQPQDDLSDRTKYHLLLTHVMGNHDTSFDKSIGIGFNARESNDADEIGAAIVHVQSGSNDVGNLSFYVKGKTQDQADPTLVLVMSASKDDRGGRVSINSPKHHESVVKWPLEVTNYAGSAPAAAQTCLRIVGELDDTTSNNFGSGAKMRFGVREKGDETEDLAAIAAIQDTATTAGKLQFQTTNMGATHPSTKMTISQEGFVGVGIDNPDTPLHLQSTSGAPGGLLRLQSIFNTVYWDIFIGNPNGNTLYFKYNGTDSGGYLDASVDVENINFTGQHRAAPLTGVASDYKEQIGMIVVSSGIYNNLADTNKKPTISESVPAVLMSSQRNQKSAFGVVADIELESESERKFAQGVFVTTFSKPDNDERLIINSLGEGGIWVCNINGGLENGDYITTCEIPGLGMRQDDDILHNYTVAKITQDCDFDTASSKYETIVFTHNGIEYKKSFVGCTYHCG